MVYRTRLAAAVIRVARRSPTTTNTMLNTGRSTRTNVVHQTWGRFFTTFSSPTSSSSSRSFHSTHPSSADALDDLPPPSPEVQQLFDDILRLNVIDLFLLKELVNEKLGITLEDDDVHVRMGGGGGGAAAGGGAAGADAGAAAAEEEKTNFDLKLTGFDAKSKIKVIKEVRTITGLGLKEAKEAVEGAPRTLQKDLKKEDAEELKAKLEAVGATVEIE